MQKSMVILMQLFIHPLFLIIQKLIPLCLLKRNFFMHPLKHNPYYDGPVNESTGCTCVFTMLSTLHMCEQAGQRSATARIWLRYQVCRIRPPLDPIAEWKLHPSSHHILRNFRDVHTTSAHRYYETYPLFSQGQSQLRKISSIYKACNPL